MAAHSGSGDAERRAEARSRGSCFKRYDWVEDDPSWRQAMMPSAELNRYPARLLWDDEVDALVRQRWWGDDGEPTRAWTMCEDGFWPMPEAPEPGPL